MVISCSLSPNFSLFDQLHRNYQKKGNFKANKSLSVDGLIYLQCFYKSAVKTLYQCANLQVRHILEHVMTTEKVKRLAASIYVSIILC